MTKFGEIVILMLLLRLENSKNSSNYYEVVSFIEWPIKFDCVHTTVVKLKRHLLMQLVNDSNCSYCQKVLKAKVTPMPPFLRNCILNNWMLLYLFFSIIYYVYKKDNLHNLDVNNEVVKAVFGQ